MPALFDSDTTLHCRIAVVSYLLVGITNVKHYGMNLIAYGMYISPGWLIDKIDGAL
jgi:hypothetical protein